jgi:hypothetical protein
LPDFHAVYNNQTDILRIFQAEDVIVHEKKITWSSSVEAYFEGFVEGLLFAQNNLKNKCGTPLFSTK